ncbi:hypothetical protein D049_1738B, partial [Vibrio parahaemolyticus VPTS-2010]
FRNHVDVWVVNVTFTVSEWVIWLKAFFRLTFVLHHIDNTNFSIWVNAVFCRHLRFLIHGSEHRFKCFVRIIWVCRHRIRVRKVTGNRV